MLLGSLTWCPAFGKEHPYVVDRIALPEVQAWATSCVLRLRQLGSLTDHAKVRILPFKYQIPGCGAGGASPATRCEIRSCTLWVCWLQAKGPGNSSDGRAWKSASLQGPGSKPTTFDARSQSATETPAVQKAVVSILGYLTESRDCKAALALWWLPSTPGRARRSPVALPAKRQKDPHKPWPSALACAGSSHHPAQAAEAAVGISPTKKMGVLGNLDCSPTLQSRSCLPLRGLQWEGPCVPQEPPRPGPAWWWGPQGPSGSRPPPSSPRSSLGQQWS